MVHFFVEQNTGIQESHISDLILKNLVDVTEDEGLDLLRSFHAQWDEMELYTHKSKLVESGKSLFGSIYLYRNYGVFVPVEITYISPDTIPHAWINSNRHNERNWADFRDDKFVLQMRIMPEYRWSLMVPPDEDVHLSPRVNFGPQDGENWPSLPLHIDVPSFSVDDNHYGPIVFLEEQLEDYFDPAGNS